MALLKVSVGDVVCIPASKDNTMGFVLSRVLRQDVVTWIEVFCQFRNDFDISRDVVFQQDFSSEQRLFSPIYASFHFTRNFGIVKWPVFSRNENDKQSPIDLSDIEFCETGYNDTGVYYRNNEEMREPYGVRRSLQDRQIYSNPQLVHRINLHLSGYFKQGEPWNPSVVKKVLEKEGLEWWNNSIEASQELAETVALEFKKSQGKLKKT